AAQGRTLTPRPEGIAPMLNTLWSWLAKRGTRRASPGRSPRRRRSVGPLCLECLEDRTLLSAGPLPPATPLEPNGALVGHISQAGQVAVFQVSLPDAGLLTAHTQAVGGAFRTRTTLYGYGGQPFAQGNGHAPGDRDNVLAQFFIPGTFQLQV